MDSPEVPLEQSQEEIAHHTHGTTEGWILGVALTAAILAACAAIASLLAEHNANEAMIEQIQSSDQWSYYQAKGIKANVLAMKIELRQGLGKRRRSEGRRETERVSPGPGKHRQGSEREAGGVGEAFLATQHPGARGDDVSVGDRRRRGFRAHAAKVVLVGFDRLRRRGPWFSCRERGSAERLTPGRRLAIL